MKALTNIRSLVACLALAAALPVFAQERPNFYGQPNLDRSAEIKPSGIEPALVQLSKLAQAGQPFADAAARAGVTVKNEQVLVEVRSFDDAANPAVTREWIAVEGLMPRRDAHISAYRAPVANSYGPTANEAEALMRADMYAAAGLHGEGVRIAVIDIGFGGLHASLDAGDVETIQTPVPGESRHGTAMIEAIRDIAPEADILALRLDAELDVMAATSRAIKAGAKIIVCPLSWFGMPGTGPACDAAALANAYGVKWVNAAGNFGDRRYFEGEVIEMVAIGADNYVDFGGDPYQFINGMNGGDKFSVHLATTGKLQLELYRWDGLSADFVLVAQGDSEAAEQVVADEYVEGMWYFPMVRVIGADAGAFRMFAVGGDLHFSDAHGSIANPYGNGVITVGAVNAASYLNRPALEVYSSIGGGIFNLTLDLCGPTGCTTGTSGPQGFNGTSAACANIAGLLALQLADPVLSADPLGMLVRENVVQSDIVFAMVDAFEPDNDPSLAGQTGDEHMISPSSDEDWYVIAIDQACTLLVSAQDCRIEFHSLPQLDVMIAKDYLKVPAIAAGEYLVRITAEAITTYTLEMTTYFSAPEAVTDMRPADGTVIKGSSAVLEWAAVQGLGPISYVLEVSKDASFTTLFAGAETTELTLEVTNNGNETLYWRVTARNEFGAAEPSAIHSLLFADDDAADADANDLASALSNDAGADDVVVSETSGLEITSVGEGTGGGNDDAAGCAGTQGAGSLAAMLAAIFGALAVMRMRRKQA
jgi:hypothetical protein